MKTTFIELLKTRIERLSDEDYELEVWKTGTTLLLERIFGSGNSYSKEIDSLKVDYSSWNLRDATSEYNPKETCKLQGREVLELAVAELSMPVEEKSSIDFSVFLEDKSGKLQSLLAQRDEAAVFKLLMKEKKEQLARLLVKLMTRT